MNVLHEGALHQSLQSPLHVVQVVGVQVAVLLAVRADVEKRARSRDGPQLTRREEEATRDSAATNSPQDVNQPRHATEEARRCARQHQTRTRLEALHARVQQCLVQRGLEQVGEPLVRVEGEMAVEVLRVVPVEGVATAGGGAGPHDATRQIGAAEKDTQLLDLGVSERGRGDEDERTEHLLAELDAEAAIIRSKIDGSDHVLSVLGRSTNERSFTHKPSRGEEAANALVAQRLVHNVPVHGLDVHHAVVQVQDVNAAVDVTNALREVEHAHRIGHVDRKHGDVTEGRVRYDLAFHSATVRPEATPLPQAHLDGFHAHENVVVLTDEFLGQTVSHGVVRSDDERNSLFIVDQVNVVFNFAVEPLNHTICNLRDDRVEDSAVHDESTHLNISN